MGSRRGRSVASGSPLLGRGGSESEAIFAFTLVEILVVIGITAVLFFLLLGPLINSFRLTQRAQMLTAAQDAGRRTLEILTRELGSAAYVFDNTSHPFSGQLTNAQIATASVQYDEFTNFLDIDVPVDPDAPTRLRRRPSRPTPTTRNWTSSCPGTTPPGA